VSVTTPHRVHQLDDGRFDICFPDANKDGMYVLADPYYGSEMHHDVNAIRVSSIDSAWHPVRKHGFPIRMRGNETRQWNLIAASKIECL
jgi:hypothetical protein